MSRRFVALTAFAVGGMIATACASPASDPSRASEEGRWVGQGPEFLTLEDGVLTGSDGCNGLNGSYSREGDTLTVRLGLSTLKACMGVDTWLRKVATATIAGDKLTVFDRAGAEIGILTRAV
ncbi:META domain-containing protein [Microbacterium testaceum StLB037]|uniref:META domain-containing protein n=1 Tax=Microbacterium testaceum (strain StLB037) TaxID=979556 RepID=A0A1H0Q8W7_MICTS|nr:META domain-containing protein [Microbacterium testaceum]SDP13475.1 META domain-containing protein [Microbacterium testaceum StLB037]